MLKIKIFKFGNFNQKNIDFILKINIIKHALIYELDRL